MDKGFSLKDDKILEILCIPEEKSEIVDSLFRITYELIVKANEHSKNLDSKASNLCVMAGLIITILFGFGKFLPMNPEIAIRYTDFYSFIIISVFYFGAFFSMFVSIILGLQVIEVRTYGEIKDTDLFCEKEIKKGSHDYKRYLVAHFWYVYKRNFLVNEEKANKLKKAQKYFLISVLCLIPCVSVFINNLLNQIL